MCAKKLSHPPKLEPDFKRTFKIKTVDSSEDEDESVIKKDTPGRKSLKPIIAGYLLIIVVIMVTFEIVNTIDSGEDYLYFSIYSTHTSLSGNIYDNDSKVAIMEEDFNITLSNYDHEFKYFFSEVSVGKHLYITQVNNTTGKYKFSNIPAGRYILNVSLNGFKTKLRKVLIVPAHISGEEGGNSENIYLEKNTTTTTGPNIITTGTFDSENLNNFRNLTYSCLLMDIVFVVITAVSITFCLKRKKYIIALIGAVFGLMGGLITIYSLASVISVMAIFLIVLSKQEFQE